MRFWGDLTVISGKLSSVVTQGSCDLVAAGLLAVSC